MSDGGAGSALDLLVIGRVATFTGGSGWGWVEAIGIREGEVVAAGRERDVSALSGPGTQRWRLNSGLVVLPGLIDAHLHLATAAAESTQVDLTRAATLEDGLALLVRHAAERPGIAEGREWLLGHGWLPDRWGRWPDAQDLERALPGIPAALWSQDHHSRLLSATALQRAGLDDGSPDPPRGVLRRDDDGHLTGVLHEDAATLPDPVIPQGSTATLADAVVRYAERLPALGLVGCHDPGELSPDPEMRRGFGALRLAAAQGRLPISVHGSIRVDQLARAGEEGLRSGIPLDAPEGGPDAGGGHRERTPAPTEAPRARRERLTMGWLKLFADGSLGSRTAAMLEPYEGEDDSGLLLQDARELAGTIRAAAAIGVATQVHAIGDRAARAALDAFAETRGLRVSLRPRVEHAQLVHPDDIPRFAALGVAASMQPLHLGTDAPVATRAWGDRTRYAFPTRAIADAGALIPLGTDAPVEPPDPWPGIALAATRHDPRWAESGPFHPEERLSVERALRAASLDVALSAQDHRGGRLLPGYRADFIVVPAAIVEESPLPGGALASARPIATVIQGELVHRASDFDP